ncbi:MAG TPA: type I phosphomannose isomerase catalytic subunit [Phycisphaerales bacterium]|nr:type I phosphomannose isomerase catalytic subunit [Phycisphaerales bacterium]
MPKVWGGDRLARFGKAVKPGDRVGESWELSDLPGTSASGAGGGAVRSVIANGPLAGKTIHDAIELWGDALLPRAALSPSGNFPLLIKFLDAREDLSVQVHPSPAYAAKYKDAHLKTECWYVLDAKPGSVIYKGVKSGVTREVFERALRAGDGSGVVDLLEAVPAVVGECHNLPSGTVHALGAGVLVAEVQTPSDTTFRVYDWGRTGRELHIEQAMECIEWGPAPKAVAAAVMAQTGVQTEFFSVLVARQRSVFVPSGCAAIVLQGEATFGKDDSFCARAGDTVFVPRLDRNLARFHARRDGERVEVMVLLPRGMETCSSP